MRVLLAVLAAFAIFVGVQIARAPRAHVAASAEAEDGEPPRYGATEAGGPSASRARPIHDPAAVRRTLAAGAYGTYIDEILAEQDSSLQHWPDRSADPIRVWVQPSSTVDGWNPNDPQLARDGFLAWQQQAGIPVRFAFVGDSASAEVHVRWVARLPTADRIGLTEAWRDAHGWIARGDITIATHGRSSDPLAENVVRATALHEVGHLLGLDHTRDTTSIMMANAHDAHMLSNSDRATAELLYAVTPGSLK